MFKFSLRVQICMTTTSCRTIISVLRFPFYADLIADDFIKFEYSGLSKPFLL